MRDYALQAAKALAVYLDRGAEAEQAFADGDVDRLTEILRRRSAAFHNFRAQDALALGTGVDLATDPAVQRAVSEIKGQEIRLSKVLAAAKDATGREVRKVRATRKALGRYRSGEEAGSRFEHSV